MNMKFNNFFGLARWRRTGEGGPIKPTLFGTLITVAEEEYALGNLYVHRPGLGVLLDADMVLADGSTHTIFEAL